MPVLYAMAPTSLQKMSGRSRMGSVDAKTAFQSDVASAGKRRLRVRLPLFIGVQKRETLFAWIAIGSAVGDARRKRRTKNLSLMYGNW